MVNKKKKESQDGNTVGMSSMMEDLSQQNANYCVEKGDKINVKLGKNKWF
jgi:co-chaperonin GroES (HSP10)